MPSSQQADPRDGEAEARTVQRDLVVVGASAGGVEALRRFVADLPPELPAAVVVVLHLASTGTSVLADILDRAGPLPVRAATDGASLRRGEVLVGPPDSHTLVHDGRVVLSRGPRENGHRPAVDPLFRSAARAHGKRTIAVVLSGMLDDGAAGLAFVRDLGGATLVQEPDDAAYGDMPRAALRAAPDSRRVPIAGMADAVCALLEEHVETSASGRDLAHAALGAPDDVEVDAVASAVVHGGASGLTCPDCGGALWEDPGEPLRFVCHVGHAFSRDSMLEQQGRALDATLWSALRALEERADLLRRVARRTSGTAHDRLERRAREAEDHATALRETLLRSGRVPTADGAPEEDR